MLSAARHGRRGGIAGRGAEPDTRWRYARCPSRRSARTADIAAAVDTGHPRVGRHGVGDDAADDVVHPGNRGGPPGSPEQGRGGPTVSPTADAKGSGHRCADPIPRQPRSHGNRWWSWRQRGRVWRRLRWRGWRRRADSGRPHSKHTGWLGDLPLHRLDGRARRLEASAGVQPDRGESRTGPDRKPGLRRSRDRCQDHLPVQQGHARPEDPGTVTARRASPVVGGAHHQTLNDLIESVQHRSPGHDVDRAAEPHRARYQQPTTSQTTRRRCRALPLLFGYAGLVGLLQVGRWGLRVRRVLLLPVLRRGP